MANNQQPLGGKWIAVFFSADLDRLLFVSLSISVALLESLGPLLLLILPFKG